MNNKRYKYVRRRSYLTAILATLGFLFAGMVFITYASGLSKQETMQYINGAVQQSQYNVDEHIAEQFQTMRSGMIFNEARDWLADDDSFSRMIQRLLGGNSFTRVGVADMSGEALWADREGNRGRANLAGEAYIQKALAGEPAVAGTRWDEAAQANVLDYAIPVYYEDDTLRGAIFVSDPEDELRDILDNSLFAGEGFAQIVDGDGGYVVKSNSPLRLASDAHMFDLPEPLDPETEQKILDDMAAGRAGHLHYGFNGDSRLAAYAPSDYNGWYVFYSVPENQINAGLHGVVYGSISIIAIAAGIFVFFILMIRYNNNKSLLELEHLAFVDPLTDGRNMQKFKIDAEKLLEKALSGQYAVYYADIKGFKYINDIFGRDVGDQLLRYLWEIIVDISRPGEVCARTNADVFVALRHFGNQESIEERYLRVAERLAAFPPTAAQGYKVELYSGVYHISPEDGPLSLDDMLDRALEAQQAVKRHGGGSRLGFYTREMRAQQLWDTEVESRMERALEDKEFKMYLQPKIDIQCGRVMGMEALVRWEPPDSDLIPPGKFIDLFERNGFIVHLDRYMLEEACRTYRDQGFAAATPPPVLSVNVSRLSLMQPDIVQDCAAVKERYGIPDGLIEVEFTEGLLFDGYKQFQEVVSGLRACGFLCSLDDFGSGYSSLNILKSLQVDVIKLDRVFFDYGNNEARGREMVRVMVSLAKFLHIKTVAEGIEDEKEVGWLREIGCDAIQGYVFSKPLPVEAFKRFLESQ